jgi:parallel beta-helix repeat protein
MRLIKIFIAAFLAASTLNAASISRAATHGYTDVVYNAATNKITVGRLYLTSEPSEAPYRYNPTHPNAPRETITMPQLASALTAIGHGNLLTDLGNKRWLLRAYLTINQTARMEVTGGSVSEWRLESGKAEIVSILGGQLLVQDTLVRGWDTNVNNVDVTLADGRPYLIAEKGGRMDIIRSEISHLGFRIGFESGLTWTSRAWKPDINTGSTGSIVDSDIHDLYFGQYSWEAIGMVVQRSKFHHNISYGFDPHDRSLNFLVEDNEFYANGNHGVVVSRGVYNMTIRRNKSYDNRYTYDNKDHDAHGFMFDPGSPESAEPPAPSYNILLEDNQAWGNDGNGLRILDSYSNTIRGNVFWNNRKGIVVEGNSPSNLIENNVIKDNAIHGVELRGVSYVIVQNNRIESNGQHGVYLTPDDPLPTERNVIRANVIVSNTKHGIRANNNDVNRNTWRENTVYNNGDGGIVLTDGAQNSIAPPSVVKMSSTKASGNASPNAIVEIFSDHNQQGKFFEGSVTADSAGAWSFEKAAGFLAPNLNATQTDPNGNSSAFVFNSKTNLLTRKIMLPFVMR